MLDPMSDVNGVATGVVEEVATNAEVSGLAAIEAVTDEEGTSIGVEVWILAGVEGISV